MITHETDIAAFAERIVMFRDGKVVKEEWRGIKKLHEPVSSV
jgi:ABC-type lipoprotein export system ATPase subunit